MFRNKKLPVLMGVCLLSCMFLLGQEAWPPCADNDEDGYGDPASLSCLFPDLDCDDDNADVNPGAAEGPPGDPVCEDAVDNDCDGHMDMADDGCEGCADDSDCDDGNTCTKDICDAYNECVYYDKDDGTPCDDGNVCTHSDTCSQGQCMGTPIDCDDGNGCTYDSCDGNGNCQHDCYDDYQQHGCSADSVCVDCACKQSVMIVLNSASNLTCNQVCASYGRVCRDIGTDSAGTNNKAGVYDWGCTSYSGLGCNDPMTGWLLLCGYWTPWTYCRCSY